ncbi:MAG TPA: dethiobiotin synthase [Solirubrobacteraceae bacterium]|nr:dethiobiotin synthase [Solirubrobacteraceae bacterium]
MSEPATATLPSVVCVTGTDTGVGKTIATAAIGAALRARGLTVAVYKPTQAGLEDGQGDIDVVRTLGGLEQVHEGIRLLYPMAPAAAAQREGVELPPLETHLQTIRRIAATVDHLLVEGAGGLLVPLDGAGHTLADVASALRGQGLMSVGAVVVCRAALGTLNHSELTFEALERRGVPITGMVIGAWPPHPGPIELTNREYFERHPVPVLGTIPQGAGALEPEAFRRAAAGWLPGMAPAATVPGDIPGGREDDPSRRTGDPGR